MVINYCDVFRFVNLVRSKTPKVTMYTKRAKCMLMENSPTADFEVIFYDGESYVKSDFESFVISKVAILKI